MLMDLLSLIPDNISEVLARIIQFTDLRRRILQRNMREIDTPGFLSRDMPVREFAELLNGAIAEHLRSRRLLFRDTPNIKFGAHNSMQIRPIPDTSAQAALQRNRGAYIELQVNKLLENALNRRVAEELFRQKCGTCPAVPQASLDAMLAGDGPIENSSTHFDTAN